MTPFVNQNYISDFTFGGLDFWGHYSIYGRFQAFNFINKVLENTKYLSKDNVLEFLAFVNKIILLHKGESHEVFRPLKYIFLEAHRRGLIKVIDLTRLNTLANIEIAKLWEVYAALLKSEILTDDNVDEVESLLTEAIPKHMYDVRSSGNAVFSESYEALLQLQQSGALTGNNINRIAQLFRNIGDKVNTHRISSHRVGSLLADWARLRAINALNIDQVEGVFNYLLDLRILSKSDSILNDFKSLINEVDRYLMINDESKKVTMPIYFAQIEYMKNILWLESLYSYREFEQVLAQAISSYDSIRHPMDNLYKNVRQNLMTKALQGKDVAEALKILIVRQILMSSSVNTLSVHEGKYTFSLENLGLPLDIDTTLNENLKKRSLARVIELSYFDRIEGDAVIFRISDDEYMVVNLNDKFSTKVIEEAVSGEKLDQLRRKLLISHLSEENSIHKENALAQYFMQLELLHLEGILQGRILYPSMGNDFFPSYFGTMYATNLYSGLGPDLKTHLDGKNYERAGFMFDYSTLDQLKSIAAKYHGFSQVWQEQQTDVHVFWNNNFNFAAYGNKISDSGKIDTIIIKGVTHWLKHYTHEGAMIGKSLDEVLQQYFDQLSAALIKPGTTVVILDSEDMWIEEFLKSKYGYISIEHQEKYEHLVKALSKMPQKQSNIMFGSVNTHVGIMPIRILMAPSEDLAMSATKGGIDLTSNKEVQIKDNGNGSINFAALDPAMLQQLQNAPGFVPVIINIEPITNLKQFLGISQPTSISTSNI